MFSLENDVNNILCQLKQRTQTIQLTEDVPQDLIYRTFLNQCADTEITPDIVMLGFERSYKVNKYLAQHYPEIAKHVWMIAETGQGDSWLLDRASLDIIFYDHDQGEYEACEQFETMLINFAQFLQFSWLLRALEHRMDETECTSSDFACFENVVNQIHPQLFKNYPFDYL